MRTASLLFAIPLFLVALPRGEEIQQGDVRFERHGDWVAVHASDGSIIQYQNFDIEQHERVEFIQPNSQSRVLNRITCSTPSQIDGHLIGNGQVYLVNPMGVIFGPRSVVDASKFFAGAARISNEDFLAHRDAFFDIQGDVINQGLLKSEEVHLIGAKVENLGWIQTPEGFVSLLSGNSVVIQNSECTIAFNPDESMGIGAMDFVGYAIRHRGSIIAKKAHIEADRVYCEGSIEAPGGVVKILGDKILLQEASIDASGKTGGGTVLIGGNYQGEGPLRQSRKTLVDEMSRIDVSATETGDGGTAAVWSKEMTYFNGEIKACGGRNGGNGGSVETSGKLALGGEKGRVDATAPFGKTGTWLLDPATIVIASAGAGTLIQAANCADTVTALTISNTTINGAMANVVLCASMTITQNANAPINIAAAGVGINYQASGLSTINSNVTTNGGAITATTSATTLSNAILNSGAGNISLVDVLVGLGGTNSTLQTTSGSINLSGTTTLSNNLILNTTGGPISTDDITGAHSLTINAGSTGTVSIGGNTNVSTITVTNSGSTTFFGTTTANSVVLTNTTGAIDFGLTVTLGSISTTTNSYSAIFGTGGTVTNAATFSNIGGVVFGDAPSSSITFTNGLNTNQPGVITSTFGTVTTTATPMSLGPVVLLGNTTLNGGSTIGCASTITGPFNLTLNTPGITYVGGAINMAGSTTNGGTLAITAGGNIGCYGNIATVGGSGGFNGGNVTMNSGGTVTVASIDTSGGSGGGSAGTIYLQPTSNYTNLGKLGYYPNGILSIYGSLTALGNGGASGNIYLSPLGRNQPLSIATITGNPAGSNLNIRGANLSIGPNEAMTILGSIDFNLQNTASVGDLVALTSITINAPTINLILHQTGQILDYQGRLYPNRELHILAGDPTLNGNIVFTGAGPNPRIEDLHYSATAFRKLLFYKSTVLNFNGLSPPVSAIIDWVLPTDFWSSTPLISQPSHMQFLALRLDHMIDTMPNLEQIWLAIERQKKNPVELAILKYASEKKLQDAFISLREFQEYLKRSDSRLAKAYIRSIQTLIFDVKQKKNAQNLMATYKQIVPTKYGSGDKTSRTSQYFINDLLEYTKPPSLTQDQWRQLVMQ